MPSVRGYISALLLAILTISGLVAAGTPSVVTGAQTGIDEKTGQVPIRRDVNAFYEAGDIQWYVDVHSHVATSILSLT